MSEDATAAREFLELAKKRFKVAQEGWQELHRLALHDLKFSMGEQWEEQDLRDRAGRPCLVINKMPQFVRQVTNEQRQNRPGIKISPVDSKSDPDTAEVIQGIIRHVEVSSGANTAYDTAFEHCARMGFGFWRIRTDYVNETSFDQKIVIDRILNPFTVFTDPSCQKPDFSDMKYAFVTEELLHEEFKEAYPGKDLSGLQDHGSIADSMKDWAGEGTVRVAEYYYTKEEKDTLVLASAVLPEVGPKKMLVPRSKLPELPGEQEWKIEKEREIIRKKIMWAKINGKEVLEETEWPIQWIPLVPCLGDEMFLDGKRDLRGMIRDAIDPQRMNNYWASKETETIALAPQAPYIGARGQFKGQERKWMEANTKPQAFLEYEPMTHGGKPLGPPQRSSFEPAIQAISMARQQASIDMESVVGLHGPSMGRRDRADSGKAIQALQREGDTGTFHYVDNLSRSKRHTGIIVLELIPHIYDVDRIERIIGADDTEQRVQIINDKEKPALVREEQDDGTIKKIFNVGVGLYDVVVETGPSYATKRQESIAGLLELTKHYPQLMEFAGDLLVGNMDAPFSKELAERLKKTLRPGLIDEEGQDPIPPQAQAKMQELEQLAEQLQAEVQELRQVVDTKKVETDSKERIERMKLEVKETLTAMELHLERLKIEKDLKITHEKLSSQEGIESLRADLARTGQELSRIADPGLSNSSDQPT